MPTPPARPNLAGHHAILNQVEYFRNNFGSAESRWKKDGTRVTIVDETISHQLFTQLEKDFSNDDFCSEEGAETIEPIPLNPNSAGFLILWMARIIMP